MTDLEQAIHFFIGAFNKYSGAEGSRLTLSKGELKALVVNELPNFFETSRDKDAIDKLMKDLDEDGDSQIDFTEFIVFVSSIAVFCNEFCLDLAQK